MHAKRALLKLCAVPLCLGQRLRFGLLGRSLRMPCFSLRLHPVTPFLHTDCQDEVEVSAKSFRSPPRRTRLYPFCKAPFRGKRGKLRLNYTPPSQEELHPHPKPETSNLKRELQGPELRCAGAGATAGRLTFEE